VAERYWNDSYTHELLLHDTDEELVERTRAFVRQGLDAGGRVLAHGSRDRVELLRRALGSPNGLDYGYDAELYRKPMQTLFAYQQKLAESQRRPELWATGSVPTGQGAEEQAAWCRYESLVNEALGAYPFHALCTYDTRTVPAGTVAAAKASHPTVNRGAESGRPSVDYLDPTTFLAGSMGRPPGPPEIRPTVALLVDGLDELEYVRRRVLSLVRAASALTLEALDELLVVVTELTANGLVHGAPPVRVRVWAEVLSVTGQVVDSGSCRLDPLSGFRYPGDSDPMGLWMVRQLVDDLFIRAEPEGGCSLLFTKT